MNNIVGDLLLRWECFFPIYACIWMGVSLSVQVVIRAKGLPVTFFGSGGFLVDGNQKSGTNSPVEVGN